MTAFLKRSVWPPTSMVSGPVKRPVAEEDVDAVLVAEARGRVVGADVGAQLGACAP